MGNLGEVFEKRLRQLGLKKQVDAARVCEAFDNSIEEVFGENGVKNAKAISYRCGVLKVGVSSSAWAQEVNLKQMQLKEKDIRIVYKLTDRS